MRDGTNDGLSLLQKGYLTFWKPILLILTLAQCVAAIWIIKALFPDGPQYAYAIGVLIAAAVAYVEIELIGYFLIGPQAVSFDWRDRSARILTIGYLFCIAVAIAMTVHESSERAASQRSREQSEAEQARFKELRDSEGVRKGLEAYERAQKLKQEREQRQTTRPAAPN
jgi:hypothetical protein